MSAEAGIAARAAINTAWAFRFAKHAPVCLAQTGACLFSLLALFVQSFVLTQQASIRRTKDSRMWHRFGQGFQDIVLRAEAQRKTDRARALSTRHLMRALEAEQTLPAAKILSYLKIAPGTATQALAQTPSDEAAPNSNESTLTPAARDAVERAYALAANLHDEYVGGEHLLLAFAQSPDASDAARVLAGLGITWQAAGQALMLLQSWRTRAPQDIPARLPARRLVRHLRGQAGQVKRFAYGLAHSQKPFMPYLLFRKRHTNNPYSFYARLRRRPAYWDPLMGHWIITRYSDVAWALAEPRLSQRVFDPDAWSHTNLPPLVQREFRCLQGGLDRQMLFQDAPDQSRQRMLVAKRFTPRVIAQMQEQMQQIADELLDAVQASEQMDVITDLAVPFPLLVITRMLGLPAEELPRFKKWSSDYFRYLTLETSLTEDFAAYQSVREAESYFRALLPARRLAPQDDLVTLFLQPGSDGELLPEDDVVANCLLLLATGHENTTRLISSGLLALLRAPEQWRKLCSEPALVGGAVEELLRYDSPVQWTIRHLREDVQWNGHLLQKGQHVQIGIGPANRDPAQFPSPDRLDIARAENRHLAFGHGPHFCLGAALTRLEAQTLFGCLAARLPNLRLEQRPEWRQEGLAFRGLRSLRVRWDAPQGRAQLESRAR